MEYLHKKTVLTEAESKKMLRTIGPIDLEIPVKVGLLNFIVFTDLLQFPFQLDAKGDPIVFSFGDCEQPVEYESV